MKLLALDGVDAHTVNVANKTYPLQRPLNIVIKGPANHAIKRFLDFLTGPGGQEILSHLDFIPHVNPVVAAKTDGLEICCHNI